MVLTEDTQTEHAARTGKELILATKPYASDNPAKSWWYVVSTTVLLTAALAGTLWQWHPVLRVASSIFSGFLILRLFVIYHDQQHHAILPNSRLADLFMRVFGMLSLSPSSIWKSSHNYHHNHNSKLRSSHIGSFPIMTKAQYFKISKSRRFKYLFMRHPLTILFGYVFIFLFGMCIYPFFNHPRKHWDSLIAFLLHLTISVTLVHYLGWTALLLTQIIPHFVASAIGSYLFYAQHNFPDASFYDHAGWTYEKAALESSSYMRMNAFMRWASANIGFHHLHHLKSRVPFYRLPEVMGKIRELQNPKTTSLSPKEIVRCLRLKVWDVEAQRMVGLS